MQNPIKLFLTTLRNKWPEFLLELLVLIIGIYGAFALDSWKENNSLEKAARSHLEVLKNDLAVDQIELDGSLSKMLINIEASEYLLDGFKKVKKMDSSAYNAFSQLVFEYNFNPQITGLTALRNSGSLTTLDEDIQKQISIYYAATNYIQEREAITNKFINEKYEALLIRDYAMIWNKSNADVTVQEVYNNDQRGMPPFDFTIFTKDPSLEKMVFGRRFQTITQKQSYENGLRELKILQNMINNITP